MRGLAGLLKLETLTLFLRGCSQLANVDVLQNLGGLAALKTLELDLYGCVMLADVDGLYLQNLADSPRSPRSPFSPLLPPSPLSSRSPRSPSLRKAPLPKTRILIPARSQPSSRLASLQTLELNLGSCTGLANVDGLDGLSGLAA